jgi:hypothetical protein
MKHIKQWWTLVVAIIFIFICYYLILDSSKNVFIQPSIVVNTNTEIKKSLSSLSCVNSGGDDISTDLDGIIEEINQTKICFQAVYMARNCAWGSSADVGITSAASNICMSEFKKNQPSAESLSVLKNMQSLCSQKYEKLQGTLYVSANAHCYLNALSWVTYFSANY